MQRSCLGGSSIMLVPKLLLTLKKIRIFGPKTAKFGPKYAIFVILGQILPFFGTCSPMPDQNTMWTRCLGGFSVMWVTKKKELFAQNDQIWQFCSLPVHLVPCWRVGWWLWRAGCISHDAYLVNIIWEISQLSGSGGGSPQQVTRNNTKACPRNGK